MNVCLSFCITAFPFSGCKYTPLFCFSKPFLKYFQTKFLSFCGSICYKTVKNKIKYNYIVKNAQPRAQTLLRADFQHETVFKNHTAILNITIYYVLFQE